MDSRHSRLALGTVQFGMKYGVANAAGKVPPHEAAEMLLIARDAGIDTLDTAVSYGDSESLLGRLGIAEFHVVSKLPALPSGEGDVSAWVRKVVAESLERLRLSQLYALLLHRPSDLLGRRGADLYAALLLLKQTGLVERIGLSIYDPAELADLHSFAVDLVQAPYNVFDRRIETSGWLRRLHESDVEVHVRSVFLQGLLLMNERLRPAYFHRWSPLWQRWSEWLCCSGVSAAQACLQFALSQHSVGRVLIGAESATQLRELLAAATTAGTTPPTDLASSDLDLLNPSRWRST